MKVTKVQVEAIKELSGNTNWKHVVEMLETEEKELTAKLVLGATDIAHMAKIQGGIIIIQEILKLNYKP